MSKTSDHGASRHIIPCSETEHGNLCVVAAHSGETMGLWTLV